MRNIKTGVSAQRQMVGFLSWDFVAEEEIVTINRNLHKIIFSIQHGRIIGVIESRNQILMPEEVLDFEVGYYKWKPPR